MIPASLAPRLRSALRSPWVRAAQAIVTLALLGWLASTVDRHTWTSLRTISPAILMLSLVTFASAQVLGGIRLWLLTPGSSLAGASAATWAGYFWSNFLPGTVGGDVVRLWRLRRGGVPAATAAGALILDRIANLIAIFGLVAFATATTSLALGLRVSLAWRVVLAGVAVLGLIAIFLLRRRFAGTFARVLEPARALARRPALAVAVILLSFVAVGVSILAQWWLARALGIEISLLSMAQIAATLTVVVMLPISLNGLGVQEAGYVAVLVKMGASTEQAIAFSLLVRLLILATSLLAGLIVLGENLGSKRSGDGA